MTLASAAASVISSASTSSLSVHSLALSNALSLARGGAITAATTAALLHCTSNKHCDDEDEDDNTLHHIDNHDDHHDENGNNHIGSNSNVNASVLGLGLTKALRGGGIGSRKIQHQNPTIATTTTIKIKQSLTPKGTSVLYMAIAMSLHYLSYSIARPSTIALFTSAKTGFAGNTAAFPLAMAFISPTSLLLLILYGKILNKKGPRGAVKQTTFLCAAVLMCCACLVYILQGMDMDMNMEGMLTFTFPIWGGRIQLIQLLVGALFIFRESYVQLLTSQYWSFMASVLTPDQSAKWFSPISGLTSITSAVSGFGMRSLVEKIGLPGALGLSGAILVTSLIFTEKAYTISDAGGFTPSDDKMTKKSSSSTNSVQQNNEKEESLIQKASGLFQRVPILKALFIEILSGQGLATLLNVLFVTKLSETLPDDSMRAGWMGKFFASINVVAMCLQFGVIPRVMPYLEPRTLWRFMPTTMVVALTYLCLNENPSLHLISGAFMLFKVMEFSIRRMLDEMVYVPLDFESRFLGKEIISVFGYRFGKSGMSLALSGLTSVYGNFGLQQLSFLTGGAACLWMSSAWNVSNRVLSRAEAESLYQAKQQEAAGNRK